MAYTMINYLLIQKMLMRFAVFREVKGGVIKVKFFSLETDSENSSMITGPRYLQYIYIYTLYIYVEKKKSNDV